MEKAELLKSDCVPLRIKQGKAISKITISEKLNLIFACTNEREIIIIDPVLGDILYEYKLGNEDQEEEGNWDFALGSEKIIVVDKDKVGVRSEYNGIFLLDTILQTPIKSSSENIQIELNKAEAESISNTLSSLETANEAEYGEVEKVLRQILNKEADFTNLLSVKREKWSLAKIDLKHSTLKSTFQFIVSELWKKNIYIPSLSISSSIVERANMLLPEEKYNNEQPLDKTQMFSEASRLKTFANWPHMNYKWALPEKMAQAGFYHNPSNNGDDRALCFICNVCLVSWEATDEPWSEHERHSPFCPFVRGQHTHNVSLSISSATAPAIKIKRMGRTGNPILGQSSFSKGSVLAYSDGLVVILDVQKPKAVLQFEVNLKTLNSKEVLPNLSYSDVDLKPADAWVMDTSDTQNTFSISEIIKSSQDQKATITSVALLGTSQLSDNKPLCSVLVAGSID